jgi:hypothetical protein
MAVAVRRVLVLVARQQQVDVLRHVLRYHVLYLLYPRDTHSGSWW